ncbi:hypothetical protein [Spirillospora sp. NPDC047279]|uniref:hypothetical protein n=1 Tax=Spirillospora sp. NPDC047279 TaxID=3155478 RepID=UPI0033D2AD86
MDTLMIELLHAEGQRLRELIDSVSAQHQDVADVFLDLALLTILIAPNDPVAVLGVIEQMRQTITTVYDHLAVSA